MKLKYIVAVVSVSAMANALNFFNAMKPSTAGTNDAPIDWFNSDTETQFQFPLP